MLLPAELVQCELCRTHSSPQKELQVIPFPTLYHQVSGGLSHSQDMICKEWRISLTSGCWDLCDKPLFTARIKTPCSSQRLGARCKAGQGGSPLEDTASWNFPAYFPFVCKTWGHSGQMLPHINRAEHQAHRHGTMHLWHDSHHPGNVNGAFQIHRPLPTQHGRTESHMWTSSARQPWPPPPRGWMCAGDLEHLPSTGFQHPQTFWNVPQLRTSWLVVHFYDFPCHLVIFFFCCWLI